MFSWILTLHILSPQIRRHIVSESSRDKNELHYGSDPGQLESSPAQVSEEILSQSKRTFVNIWSCFFPNLSYFCLQNLANIARKKDVFTTEVFQGRQNSYYLSAVLHYHERLHQAPHHCSLNKLPFSNMKQMYTKYIYSNIYITFPC